MSNEHRLPIHHPAFKYTPSRNPYAPKLAKVSNLAYSDNDTETHAGSWREKFPAPVNNSTSPLHVEIGCNGGHVILEWAARDPKSRYIGLDWKFKQIYFAAEKAAKRDLRNLLFFRAHADRLAYMFGQGEIDHLYLFFPDPWPKKAQKNNRWVSERNLQAAAHVVRPGGVFWIKTDHPGYFEWMESVTAQPSVASLWQVVERSTDLHVAHPDPTQLTIPDVTLFERLFIRDGIPIHSLRLMRRQ